VADDDDDDDEWPEPERDPEKLEIARQRFASTLDLRKKILRWTYAALGLLLILVILLATLR
jgi:hypothetical protein